ncbi:RDD family protein [Chitiniphilus shinanonensis]|uniref:RDD family protein n=1 Tax=Chitiniphilus shinanonensis TaxID=553088 RepID=A0ABQ6BQP2_9NEIS|nr:RDD family protein [Chitiniphilus shinanonensis]GLS03958.1 RDD family protein [Chitiniphilus shinanonensis]
MALPTSTAAGWWRRFFALWYEGLLVVPVVLLLSVPPVAVQALIQGLLGQPLTGMVDHPVAHAISFAWMLGMLFLYFGWCWRHGGQTLAMKTWRICLVDVAGGVPSWRALFLRFALGLLCYAPLGPLWLMAHFDPHWIPWAWLALGWFVAPFVWAWFDRDGQLIYDRFAGTRLLYAPGKRHAEREAGSQGQQEHPVA